MLTSVINELIMKTLESIHKLVIITMVLYAVIVTGTQTVSRPESDNRSNFLLGVIDRLQRYRDNPRIPNSLLSRMNLAGEEEGIVVRLPVDPPSNLSGVWNQVQTTDRKSVV